MGVFLRFIIRYPWTPTGEGQGAVVRGQKKPGWSLNPVYGLEPQRLDRQAG